MNADTRGLKHKQLTETIIGVFFEVYNELGHGFLESVYERAFEVALTSKGLDVRRQIQVPVWFRGHKVGDFVADVLVDRSVLLELKAARTLDSAHEAQLLNYLRATEIEVGLLFNFGIKPEFRRLAFDNSRKQVKQLNEISIAALLKPNE
ncbi:MAG TPA: GxxExxY protein [Pyrinomonadaceae bacterium]|jgi:GxxExxY protein|nr:GxxExxY protein [Pyrinomonadaceae bacterium]